MLGPSWRHVGHGSLLSSTQAPGATEPQLHWPGLAPLLGPSWRHAGAWSPSIFNPSPGSNSSPYLGPGPPRNGAKPALTRADALIFCLSWAYRPARAYSTKHATNIWAGLTPLLGHGSLLSSTGAPGATEPQLHWPGLAPLSGPMQACSTVQIKDARAGSGTCLRALPRRDGQLVAPGPTQAHFYFERKLSPVVEEGDVVPPLAVPLLRRRKGTFADLRQAAEVVYQLGEAAEGHGAVTPSNEGKMLEQLKTAAVHAVVSLRDTPTGKPTESI